MSASLSDLADNLPGIFNSLFGMQIMHGKNKKLIQNAVLLG